MVVPSSNKSLSPAVVPPSIFDTFLHRPTPIVSIFKDILNYLFHRRPIGLIELFRIQPHCQLWNQDLMEIFGMKNSKKDLKNMHSVKLQLCIRNLSCWSLGIGSSLCQAFSIANVNFLKLQLYIRVCSCWLSGKGSSLWVRQSPLQILISMQILIVSWT